MFTRTTHNILCGIICSLILLACTVLVMLAAAGPQFKYARRDIITLELVDNAFNTSESHSGFHILHTFDTDLDAIEIHHNSIHLDATAADADSPPKPPGSVVVNNGQSISSFSEQPPAMGGE